MVVCIVQGWRGGYIDRQILSLGSEGKVVAMLGEIVVASRVREMLMAEALELLRFARKEMTNTEGCIRCLFQRRASMFPQRFSRSSQTDPASTYLL